MRNTNILIQNGVDLEKGLELFGDIDMYNESLGDFMTDIHEKLAKIAGFKEALDMENYAIMVHSLKSDAKYFGFNTLGDMAYSHEIESKSNNTVFVNANYNALMAEASRMVNVVAQYLGGEAPVAPVQSAPTPTPTPTPVISAYNDFVSGKPSILVVDDSDIIQKFIGRIFEENYNVIMANNGAEAISLMGTNDSISAMLLDLNMPEVDGFAVLEHMKERDMFKKIPVSIITGNDAKEVDLQAFKYPIIDILKKPFNENSVKNIVERTLNK